MELVHREAQYNELKNVKKIMTPDLMVLAVEGGPILMQHPGKFFEPKRSCWGNFLTFSKY